MKTLPTVALFGISIIAGLLISLFVTSAAWSIQIQGRAFHCTDDCFGFYWDNLGVHEHAGDTLAPGWTWEKLRTVKAVYVLAFFSIWIAISALPIMITRSKSKRYYDANTVY